MKIYRYLYYRLYSWNLKTWGEKDIPQWNALFGVSFMMFLNLGLLGLLLQLLGVNIFLRDELPKKELVIIMISLFVLNYFLFVHKGNYRSIAKELKKETPEKRRANAILIWLYVILSFALFVLSAMFIKKLNG
jgi:DMSO reductase anchor subunit